MEIENILKILRKRLRLFILASCFVFVCSSLFTIRQPEQFQTSVKVLLMPEKRLTGPSGSYRENMPHMAEMIKFETRRNIETQLEILKSKPVRRKAEKLSGLVLGKETYDCFPQKVGDSDVVVITCLGSGKEKVIKFANSFASAYIKHLQELRVSETRDAREFIEDQIDTVRKDLARAKEELREFKERTGIVNLSQESASEVSNIVKFKSDLERLKIDLIATRSRMHKINEQISTNNKEHISATVIAENPLVQQLRSRVASLEAGYAGMSKTHGRKHPKLIEIGAELKQTKSDLRNKMEKIISSQTKTLNPVHTQLVSEITRLIAEDIDLQSRQAALEATISALQEDLMDLPESEMKLESLVAEKMLKEQLFTYLQEKYHDFEISEKTRILPAKILERADGARKISGTRKMYSFIFAFLIALSFGLGVVFFAEYMDDAIYTAEDVKRYLDLNVIGQIPLDRAVMKVPLVTYHHPNSPLSEGFRTLRNKLAYLVTGFHGKIILITSSTVEEGKSFVASNLAITLARFKLKVLLMDCDLRRPTLHEFFNFENRGLTNVFVDGEELDDVILQTVIEGLDLLCGGPVPLIESGPIVPSELFESDMMADLFMRFGERYDVIVIDSPPLLIQNDVLALSKHATGVLLVIDSGCVKCDDSIEAKSELELSHAPIHGAVLNKVEGKPRGYYKYHYYYTNKTPEENQS